MPPRRNQLMDSRTKQELEDEVASLRKHVAQLETSCRFSGHLQSMVEERTEELRTLNQELHASQQRYQQLFREMLDGFALHEIICDDLGKPCDYRFLEVNHAFEMLTGLKAENIVGHTILEALPGTEQHWIDTYGKVALTGEPVHFEDYAGELDKYYEVTAYCP
ncbi:MAG: PAS domain-containing protein, partial [Lentisphaerae bacterium]|nr:PAS domain-containing protein [Lentisphaerota bacterium]